MPGKGLPVGACVVLIPEMRDAKSQTFRASRILRQHFV